MILAGAAPALGANPTELAYGVAKAGVHHLVKSLASPGSGLPSGARVVGMLPVRIDTPMNRKFNPEADFSTWTPTNAFSQQVLEWAIGQAEVQQGGLYVFKTENFKTTVELANPPTGASS